MKNIQSLLFYFEMINQWRGFSNMQSIFSLTPSVKYAKMFDEVYYGLSHEQSKYELYITSNKNTGAIGFMVEDRDLNAPVLFGNLQDWGNSTRMYPEWMKVQMESTQLAFYDKNNKIIMNVDPEILEEEHFQLMMIHDLPPFETLHKAIDVNNYLRPIAKKHKIGFSIDYAHLDMDFTYFFPSNKAFDIIDSVYGNALQLYYEAEEHGNPFNYYVIS